MGVGRVQSASHLYRAVARTGAEGRVRPPPRQCTIGTGSAEVECRRPSFLTAP